MTRSGNIGRRTSARRTDEVSAVFRVLAPALAVSPTALVDERGRPGAPSARQANLDQFFHLLRSLLRSVTRSD
jgi:hypothetical protein